MADDLKVVSFKNTQAQNGELVIKRLEEALAMAKEGGVANCVVIMALSDGSVIDGWANTSKPFVMVGAIEAVKREFMDSIIEKR